MNKTTINTWQEHLASKMQGFEKVEDIGHEYEKWIALNPTLRASLGAFYTPLEIVNYMVENTLGVYLVGKQPNEITALKILDPACGGGFFLVSAYKFLLNWYAQFSSKKELTTENKIAVLKRHIFGIDIDKQAVEITILSLSITALPANTSIVIDLSENIICENTLLLADDSLGFFDIIIGNPPWSSKMPNNYIDYITKTHQINAKNLNFFAPFILKGLNLLSEYGLLCLLVPKVFIKNTSYTDIRKKIITKFRLEKVIDFGKFPNVASDCVSTIVSKKTAATTTLLEKYIEGVLLEQKTVEQSIFSKNPVCAFSLDIDENTQKIIEKINTDKTILAKICIIRRGIELGQKSLIGRCKYCKKWNEIGEKYYNKESNKSCKSCKKKLEITRQISISQDKESKTYNLSCVAGRDIEAYFIKSHYYIPHDLKGIDLKDDIFLGDKIFIKRIATKPEGVFVPDTETMHAFNTVYSLHHIKENNPKYILGILNSKLMAYYYERVYNLGMNLTSQITIEYLGKLPIKISDLNIKKEKQQHDELVELVEKMIELRKRLSETLIIPERDLYQRLIKSYLIKINEKVYELYELTPEEIDLIENYE